MTESCYQGGRVIVLTELWFQSGRVMVLTELCYQGGRVMVLTESRYQGGSIDIIPLEMEFAETGIRISPDRNNGMLVMYRGISKITRSRKLFV